MASQQQQADEVAEVIASFITYYVGNYCGFATIALYVYDCVITLDKEVALFWKRKVTGASLLFFLNRYIFLAGSLLELGGLSPMSAAGFTINRCSRYILAAKAIEYAQYLPWAAFSALRLFALSCATRNLLLNRLRWPITVVVLLLSLVPLTINYYSYSLASGIIDPVFGCSGTMDVSLAMSRICTLRAYRNSDFALTLNPSTTCNSCDCLAILLDSGRPAGASGLAECIAPPDWEVLLHLRHSYVTIDQALVNLSYMSIFTEPITALLVSRMLLNLQEVNQGLLHSDTASGQPRGNGTTTSLNFARVVGSLGSAVSRVGAASMEDLVIEEEHPPHGFLGEGEHAPCPDDENAGGKEASV
ncbi:hypothetical protein OH77DRAFT_1437151 [Trametes cingulata]|nr:hypothetical protein OH77DRAFT_1437151 [Trametes cingulata]